MLDQSHERQWQWTAALLGTMLACTACSPGRLTEPVEGFVTLDGQPLADIRVTLEPKSTGLRDSGVGSYGLTDDGGHFVMRLADSDANGVIIGLHTVILSDKRLEIPDDAGYAGKMKKSRIPEKYSRAPLILDVRLGKTSEVRFDLTSE
jgi:hypothetical protein